MKRIVLFLAAFASLFFISLSANRDAYIIDQGVIRIPDFSYYCAITQSFFFTSLRDVYNSETQRRVVAALTGGPTNPFPLNIFPVGLIVLSPFAVIAEYSSYNAAFSAWMSFSLCLLVFFLGALVRKTSPLTSKVFVIFCLFAMALSSSLGEAIQLGQTSILFAGLLTGIEITSDRGRKQQWLQTMFLVLMAIKPTYFALGFALLVSKRAFVPALYGMVIAASLSLLLTPILTIHWPLDFLSTMGIYFSKQPPAYYMGGIVLDRMNIAKNVFSPLIGQAAASLLSLIILAAVFSWVIAQGLSCKKSFRASNPTSLSAIIFSYLLFAPHLGRYEEILLAPALALLVFRAKSPALPEACLWLTTLAILLNTETFYSQFSVPMGLFWTIKLLLALSAIRFSISAADQVEPVGPQ